MVRDVAFAYAFGAGQAWDAFVIAFTIPNMFRHLFGEGALTSAFLPAFVGRLERSKEEARTLLRALCGSMILMLGAITAAAIGVTFLLEALFDDSKLALTMRTLRITLPYAPLICLTAVFGAALNGLRRFAIPALAPVLLNIVLIATVFIEPWGEGDWGQLQLLAWA
ncbi:MAG TPA: lipid II flippase MurJ, partial [Planctomycetota bacterium]|nr:lipid II flippase MurJ [Planctomycetota bacterium]